MFKKAFYYFCIISSITLSLSLLAEEASSAGSPEKENPKKNNLKEERSETNHIVKINGVDVSYKATIGTQLLKDEEGTVKGNMSYIAYTKDGEDSSSRPITFCFNGGPGSSSVWLHMGTFGPKRVALNEEGYALLPYHFVDNEYSILDVTDLVFIDPISTGYSKTAPGVDVKQFHGVDEDIRTVAEFIRLFATRNGRWDSPKFLAGESYGTTRAAGLAGYLHDEYCMYFNGILLVSSILNFQANDFNEGNDLPYMLFLPTYTATAWYHKRLSSELQAKELPMLLDEVKEFANREYALALIQGDILAPEEKEKMAQKLSYYTGLSANYYEDNNLRVNIYRFSRELLRKQKRTIGRFDGRFVGINNDVTGDSSTFDPSLEAVCGAFTATFNQYVRQDLKWEIDEQYKILANVSPWDWTYNKAVNQYLYVADTLRQVMTKNPALRVFVASGYYDLATPFAATEYTFQHLGLDPTIRSHVSMAYYDAGHMMYIYRPAMVKFKQDVTKFIKNTLSKDEQKNSVMRIQTRGINASLD